MHTYIQEEEARKRERKLRPQNAPEGYTDGFAATMREMRQDHMQQEALKRQRQRDFIKKQEQEKHGDADVPEREGRKREDPDINDEYGNPIEQESTYDPVSEASEGNILRWDDNEWSKTGRNRRGDDGDLDLSREEDDDNFMGGEFGRGRGGSGAHGRIRGRARPGDIDRGYSGGVSAYAYQFRLFLTCGFCVQCACV